ncbi:MAG: hypothetical protein LRY67_03975, partial [Gammaproteobacteria bacterium]|nr:hypothetical protein [Gammaproteobacteria bacterium]
LVVYKGNKNIVRLNVAVFSIIVALFFLLCCGLIFSDDLQALIFHNFGGHFCFSMLALSFVGMFCFFVLVGFYFFRKNLMRFLTFACMMVFLIYGMLNLIFDPFEKEFTRIVPMARQLHQQELNHDPIGLYELTYLGQFDYVARLTRPITVLKSFDELKLWLKQHPHGAVILYEKTCRSLNLNLVTIETYRERSTVPAYSLCRREKKEKSYA